MALKAKKMCKTFDHPVITDFSLEVMRGDKIAVIGNNGMGKTTLLKMLAGVYEPDSGSVTRGHQTEVGYFPQNHEDFIDKTEKISCFDWLDIRNPFLLVLKQPKALQNDVLTRYPNQLILQL